MRIEGGEAAGRLRHQLETAGDPAAFNVAELLAIGGWSFLINAPFAAVANYLIQNKAKYEQRFFWSAVFSAVVACYYALSEVLLR